MQSSNRTNAIWIVLVAILTSATTALLVRTTANAPPPAKATELAKSSPEVIVERQVVVRDSETRAAGEDNLSAPSAAPVKERLTPEEEAEAHAQAVADKMAVAFGSDGPADAGSREVEARIRSVLSDRQLSGVQLDKVECRAQVCRAEATFANSTADEAALQRLIVDVCADKYTLVVPTRDTDATGSIKATAYLVAPLAWQKVASDG
ncbi:MAG: hypothetical protein QM784_40210 [Polyangiaceae bacterium]